jgi:hypothetical protein
MTEAAQQDNRYRLSAEDAARMARLSEEVRGRLEEMASIAARVMGRRLDKNTVRTFEPHGPTVVEVEILDDFLGPGHRPCCLVALSDGDWIVECPCGSAG